MKEDFLHYVWNYKKFDFSNLKTVCKKNLSVIDTGKYLQSSGADFFNAQLKIDGLHWVGNVEIHIKSSDWYAHNHHIDSNYDNVILHVVWDYDLDVYRKNNTEIPVLQLKDYVKKEVNEAYMNLKKDKSWLFCENQIHSIDNKILHQWKSILFTERLLQKSLEIEELLLKNKNDWESTLFCILAKNFGLNINGGAFFALAQSIPFSIIRKEAFEVENLEALFLGKSKLLDNEFEDNYVKNLQYRWSYLKSKHLIQENISQNLEFFKHRPNNFPTIRLAQLAMLYHKNQYFFDTIINSNSVNEIYKIFSSRTSEYWESHYVLDKQSPTKKKNLSKSFIDLLIINTIIPFRFAYSRYQNKNIDTLLKELMFSIKPEKNTIIDRFNNLKISSLNAFDTQALLQLKKQYCDFKRCIDCKIGQAILK